MSTPKVKRLKSFMVQGYDENESIIVVTQERFQSAEEAQHWIDANGTQDGREFVVQALNTDRV